MEHMSTIESTGTVEPSRYVYTRRADISEALEAAQIQVRRFNGYATDRFVVNYVHLLHGADVAEAARIIAGLGWRNTKVTNIDGMLAVDTTF